MNSKKITIEIIIIAILWVSVIVSYVVAERIDVPYGLAIAGLTVVSLLYSKRRELSLLLLMLLLLLAVFNIIRFSIAFNLYIWIFNILPLVLLIALILKRKRTIGHLWNKL